jgi:transposase
MSYEIRADYRQRYMFPPSLEDWIPEDHPARFIRDFVDSLDLEELGFEVERPERGRPNYAADLLLKVWLHGYWNKIRSTRALERACMDSIACVWLTGRHAPDHNTLWRFWRRNRKALRRLFQKSVVVAAKADLVGMVLHAIDGTKIQSAASGRSGWTKKDLERLVRELDRWIDETEGEIEVREKEEAGEYRLPEEMADAKERRHRIEEALGEMEETGEERRNLEDGEARMMRGENGVWWGYNAQAVVDGESGLIVGGDVTNEPSDNNLLVPMLEQVEETLGEVADENVADGGYRSGAQVQEAEERGYEVLVGGHPEDEGEGKPYHASRFRYEPEEDCCLCPEGRKLPFSGRYRDSGQDHWIRVYRCRDFRTCPARSQCTRAKGGRLIKIRPWHESNERQREKRSQPESQALLQRRKVIVEPVFAWIKHIMGFRRWTMKGLENNRTQWSLLCLTVNLRRLYKAWRAGKIRLEAIRT